MSAPPSPSNSEASTANFTLEALADEVLDAFGDHPPPTARASVEAWLQHLEAGGVMPSPQELIGLHRPGNSLLGLRWGSPPPGC